MFDFWTAIRIQLIVKIKLNLDKVIIKNYHIKAVLIYLYMIFSTDKKVRAGPHISITYACAIYEAPNAKWAQASL